jgi:hypothetical protein
MLEAPHIKLTATNISIKNNADLGLAPSIATQPFFVSITLSGHSSLSGEDLEQFRERVLLEGIKIYVTGSLQGELFAALQSELIRTEHQRDEYRVQKEHAEMRVRALEAELLHKNSLLAMLTTNLAQA